MIDRRGYNVLWTFYRSLTKYQDLLLTLWYVAHRLSLYEMILIIPDRMRRIKLTERDVKGILANYSYVTNVNLVHTWSGSGRRGGKDDNSAVSFGITEFR